MIEALENPGSQLEPLRLNRPVVSCESAATAKQVPVEHELKSLLVTCDRGHVLVHVRGSQRVSLRAVKRSLGVRQARLAAAADLHALDVSPGTVHPFATALWPMTHLLERTVLDLPWITTNAGDRFSYVVFEPSLLLRAPSVTIGRFGDG